MAKRDTQLPGIPELEESAPEGAIPVDVTPEGEPETTEPRRRRRRRKSEPEPAAPAPAISPEEQARINTAMGLAFRVVAMAVASKRGDHWRLTTEEEQHLGAAWGLALAPYLPKIGPAVPFAAALAVTVSVALVRIERDKTLAVAEDARTLSVAP